MKEPNYPLTSWVGYTNYIKENINRDLTETDYKTIMQAYINRKDVNQLMGEMEDE